MQENNGMKLFESTSVNIPVGTFRLELESYSAFQIVDASPAFCEMLNCNAEQLDTVSTQFVSLIHPEDRSSFELVLAKAFQDKERIIWEGRLRIEAIQKPVRIDLMPTETGGQYLILESVIQDLTEVIELEASFASVLDAAQAYTWKRDIPSEQSQFDLRWAEFAKHDYETTKMQSADWLAKVHPEDLLDVKRSVRALERGYVEHDTLLYRRKLEDGTWVWLRVHAGISERDHLGNPTALSGVSFDVTAEMEERARAQNEQRELREALDETRAVLERTAYEITENIPVGTYTMVLKSGEDLAKFGFMSRKFLEITGLEEEEARADPLKAFACVHPDEFEDWVKKNAHAFENKIPFREETRLLVNGTVTWVVAESHPRQKQDGTWIWEGVIQDITEQKRAEEALHKANAQLVASEALNARLEERQQILQDIHDGFGNQLAIGKLRLSRGAAKSSDALQIIDDCLDDLRLVFASLDAQDDNLWSVLSQICDRLEKRVRRLPIALNWNIDAARQIVI